jgi:hypothetical protein
MAGSASALAHEVIVKVVNMSGDAVDTSINLKGTGKITLSGNAGTSFQRIFPTHSLTVLRIPATPQ